MKTLVATIIAVTMLGAGAADAGGIGAAVHIGHLQIGGDMHGGGRHARGAGGGGRHHHHRHCGLFHSCRR